MRAAALQAGSGCGALAGARSRRAGAAARPSYGRAAPATPPPPPPPPGLSRACRQQHVPPARPPTAGHAAAPWCRPPLPPSQLSLWPLSPAPLLLQPCRCQAPRSWRAAAAPCAGFAQRGSERHLIIPAHSAPPPTPTRRRSDHTLPISDIAVGSGDSLAIVVTASHDRSCKVRVRGGCVYVGGGGSGGERKKCV
jgi:hypothetical protein